VTDTLTLSAALVLGLLASGHCAVMCGGISAALGLATSKRADGRPQMRLMVAYQCGRVLSYALAGLLIGGVLGAFVNLLDLEAVRRTLRALSALALLLGAWVVSGRMQDPAARIGRILWPKLAPLGRRLLPVNSLPRALAFGMVWGWMPCGMVYTVLFVAALQVDAIGAAATMTAFGMGTAPAMLAASFGAQRLLGFTARPAGRRVAGSVLVACAVLTFTAPWLVSSAPALHGWVPFYCSPGR
jgi:sulfite exporter TauE/SafE